MLDELLDIFDRGDDDDDGRRRNRSARQGGIRGFISRLFGTDDDDVAEPDGREARRRDRQFDEDDEDYERAGRRRSRRDRDDDGWFDFGD